MDYPDLIEDTPRMRRILGREGRNPTDDHAAQQVGESPLPDSITWRGVRGITPEREGER